MLLQVSMPNQLSNLINLVCCLPMSLMRCLPLAHNLGIARFKLTVSPFHAMPRLLSSYLVYTPVAHHRILRICRHDQSYLPSLPYVLLGAAAFSPQHPDLIEL